MVQEKGVIIAGADGANVVTVFGVISEPVINFYNHQAHY